MKYNRSEIMKKAWEFFRMAKVNNWKHTFRTFGECLRVAWRLAKEARVEAERKAKEATIFTGKKAVSFEGFTFRFWQGGKNRRIYINGYHDGGAYIDLADNRIVTFRKTWDSAIKAAENFMKRFEIAC